MTTTAPTTPLTYPTPPPTVNNLDAQARTRLVRSTRKLGVVLGTTPFLIEVTSPTASSASIPITPRTKAYRREGRFFGHSPSSSISSDSDWEGGFFAMDARGTSLETSLPPLSLSLSIESPTKMKSSKPASKKPLAQPLLLRLRSVPVPPTRSTSHKKTIRTLPPTPLSPTFSHNSTSTDIGSSDKERDARRKKMAKLTRTLGENIPPELVFPSPPSSSRPSLDLSPSAPLKPRSKSILKPKAKALPPPPASAPTLTTAPTAQLQAHVPRPTLAERRNRRRPRSLSLGSSTEFQRAAAMAHTEQKGDSNPPKKERKQKPVPLSLEKLYLPPAPQTQTREPPASLKDIYTPPKGPIQPPPRSSSIATSTTKHRYARSSPSNIIVSPPQESQGRASADGPAFSTMEGPSISKGDKITRPQPNQGRRKEREWSGEWNHDMDEVVRRLRTLGR